MEKLKTCIILTIFVTLIVVRWMNEDAPWFGAVTYFGLLVSVWSILWRLKVVAILNQQKDRDKIDYIYIIAFTCTMVAILVLIITSQIVLTVKVMDIMTLMTLIFTILDNAIVKILRWIITGGVLQVKKFIVNNKIKVIFRMMG